MKAKETKRRKFFTGTTGCTARLLEGDQWWVGVDGSECDLM